jgi:phosphoglycerate dehydrogenase-like enzyme
MKRCLYAGTLSLPEETVTFLAGRGIELINNPYGRPLTEDDLCTLLKDYDAVLAGPEPYTAKVMDSAPNLKIIARTGVGYDKVDVASATKRHIFVTWTPIPELAHAMAEQTFALILSSVKRVPYLNSAVRAGRWERQTWSKEVGDLYPLTLGLLGVGRIGSEVAKRAKAFQMKVIYYDAIRMNDLETSLGIEYVSLDDLFARSDIISIHVPLTPQTKGIINEGNIAKMKKNAIIVNTARGPVIDEKSLAAALIEKRLGGAALDVLTEEPPTEHHIFYKLGDRIPELIITPHVGFGTPTTNSIFMAAAADVAQVLAGHAPKYPINKELLGNT